MSNIVPIVHDTIVEHLHTHPLPSFPAFMHTLQQSTHEQIPYHIQALLHQHGLLSTSLPTNSSTLVYEQSADTSQTLLLYTPYWTSGPSLQQARSIFTTFAALQMYQQLFPHVPLHVRWLIDGWASPNAPHLPVLLAQYPHLFQNAACLCAGNDQMGIEDEHIALLVLGCKGHLRISLTSQTAASSLPLMHSALVPDALWRLIWALQSIKNAHEEILIDGFYDLIVSSNDAELESLYRLPDKARELAQRWGLPQLLLGLHGFQQYYVHLLLPTCTITHLQGGEDPSASTPTIPSHATAIVDFQLVPGQQPDAVFSLLQHHLQDKGFQDITLRPLHKAAPFHTALEHPFAQLVYHASTIVYDQHLAVLPLTAGHLPFTNLQHALQAPLLFLSLGHEPFFVESIHQLVLILQAFHTSENQPIGP